MFQATAPATSRLHLPGALEPIRGQGEQNWCRGEIPIGCGGIDVAEIGRQPRQARLDIDSGTVPVMQGLEGEGVAQVVKARPAITSAANPAEPEQTQEHVMEVLVNNPPTEPGDEEAWLGAARP